MFANCVVRMELGGETPTKRSLYSMATAIIAILDTMHYDLAADE